MLAEKAEVLSSLEFGSLFSPDRRRSYPFHPSFVLVLSASGSRPLLLQPLKDYCVILLTPVPNTVRHCVMSLRLKAPSSHPLFHRLYFTSEFYATGNNQPNEWRSLQKCNLCLKCMKGEWGGEKTGSKKTQHRAWSDPSVSAAAQQTASLSGETSWHLPPRELSKQCLHLFCSLSYILSSEASARLGICQRRWELSLLLLWCFFPLPNLIFSCPMHVSAMLFFNPPPPSLPCVCFK